MASGKPKSRSPSGRTEYRLLWPGWMFVAAMALVVLAAVNTQRAMMFVLSGVMLGALFFSVAVARRMLSSVEVCREMPLRAYANQIVHLGYHLRLRRRFGPAMGLELAEHKPPAALQSVGACCLYLPAGGTFKSGSRFCVRRRGRYELDVLRLSTRFPLSLVRAQRKIGQKETMIVWPALGRLLGDVLARGASDLSLAAPSQVHSGADEFFGLREYRQGDSPRWIHWKRTASTGTTVVREMSKPRPDVLYVVLDTHLASAADDATRERLIRFAATVIDQALQRDYRVGLALSRGAAARVLPDGAGRGHRTALLDALAQIDDGPQVDPRHIGSALRPHLAHGAILLCLGADAQRLAPLAAFGGLCRSVRAVTPDKLDELFRDPPLPAAQEAP